MPACANINQDRAKNRPRNGQPDKPTKIAPRLPIDEPSKKKTAQRAINCAERKGRQFLPSSCFRFSFEREIFRSDKSFLFRTTFGVRHFFSALSGSFGHLCTSRNARVTGFALRGHQVIYAKSPTAHIRYSLVPSQYSPSTGQALAHRSRSRKGQSPKSAVIRGLHNNMPPTTSARNPFGANLHQVAHSKLLGTICPIDFNATY